MAKIKKRKSKSIGPVSEKCIILQNEINKFSNEDKKSVMAIHDTAEIVKENQIDVQIKSIPDIPINEKLSFSAPKVISITDLTDQSFPNIKSDANIECIDITNSDNDESCKLLTPLNSEMLSSNDVQNKPIVSITLDDSEEESTSCQNSTKKLFGFRSVKQIGISSKSKAIRRRSYNSSFHNKKMFKGKDVPKQEFLPLNLGTFVIDNRRMYHHSKYFKKFNKTASVPHQFTPSSDTTSNKHLRPIIIDGLNIGHAHGCGIFSPKGIQLCIQYFADRGHKNIVAFIPQHRQGVPGTRAHAILTELVKRGQICYTPSRMVQNLRMTCYDDRILLNYAHSCNGVVVSNDNFRDLYNESDAIKEIIENRQVMVTFYKDQIIVPEDQYNRKRNVRSLSDILCFPA